MNSTFALVLVGLLAAAVYGELCKSKSDCADTTCNTGDVECVGISGNHLCTCIHGNMDNINCTARADCQMDSVMMDCDVSMRHCYDESCRCEGHGHQHPHPPHPTHPPHGAH